MLWNAEVPPGEIAEAFAAVHRRVIPDSLVARRPPSPGADPYGARHERAAEGIRATGVAVTALRLDQGQA